MCPWFRRKHSAQGPSEDAKSARKEVDTAYATALTKLSEAKQLKQSLHEIRARNHFAESLTTIFGDTRRGH